MLSMAPTKVQKGCQTNETKWSILPPFGYGGTHILTMLSGATLMP